MLSSLCRGELLGLAILVNLTPPSNDLSLPSSKRSNTLKEDSVASAEGMYSRTLLLDFRRLKPFVNLGICTAYADVQVVKEVNSRSDILSTSKDGLDTWFLSKH